MYVHTYICVQYASIYCASQTLKFSQIEDLWQLCVKQIYWHFLTSFAPFAILCPISRNPHNISNFFIIIASRGDLWSMIFSVTIAKRLQLAEALDDG